MENKPVTFSLWDRYESLVETPEIMRDEDLMAALRKGIREVDEGRTIPRETVKAKLGR